MMKKMVIMYLQFIFSPLSFSKVKTLIIVSKQLFDTYKYVNKFIDIQYYN